MRVLVDTNVYLDLLLKRDSFAKDALAFFVWCRAHHHQSYITSMSLRDIEYAAKRHFRDQRRAGEILSQVYSLCSKVIGISPDAAITAIYEGYADYEDGLIIEAAKEAMVDAIVTNNIKDFQGMGVAVFTPAEIVRSASFVSEQLANQGTAKPRIAQQSNVCLAEQMGFQSEEEAMDFAIETRKNKPND